MKINLFILLVTSFSFGNAFSQEVQIPDYTFKQALISQGVDKNANGIIELNEAEQVTNLTVSGAIYNLTGLEAFTNLENFDCSNLYFSNGRFDRTSTLSSLDISKNTKLKVLNCSYNNLKILDISKNTALQKLICENNKLKALDISGNINMYYLSFGDSIAQIDASQNLLLKTVELNYNNRQSFDFSTFKELESLNIYNSELTSLNLNANNKLKNLALDYYKGNSLDVTPLLKLESLSIYSTPLTGIDISQNINLTKLRLVKTFLEEIILAPSLTYIDIEESNLSSINLKQCPLIDTLILRYNKISSLDLSQNTALIQLDCYRNKLGALNTSNLTSLTSLNCSYNSIDKLNLASNKSLSVLSCDSNQLTALDISKNIVLKTLSCSENKLTNLDLSKNLILQTVYCPFNNLFHLDARANLLIQNLVCTYNSSLNSICVSKDSVQNFYVKYFWVKDNKAIWSDSCKTIPSTTDSLEVVYISDPEFLKTLISKGVDQNQNGKIEKYEALIPTKLDFGLFDTHFSDMTGIEAFSNLEILNIGGASVLKADISQNASLKEITLINTRVDSINISKIPYLKALNIASNRMKNLDLSHNKDLSVFRCDACFLDSIDLTHNLNLKELNLSVNSFVKLDLSKNNQLSKVNLSANNQLYKICVSDVNYAENNPDYIKPVQAIWSSCSPTGIDEVSYFKDGLQLYPNPTKDLVSFNEDIIMAEVYNIMGELIITSIKNSIDFSDSPKGCYFIKVLDSKKRAFNFKLIKE